MARFCVTSRGRVTVGGNPTWASGCKTLASQKQADLPLPQRHRAGKAGTNSWSIGQLRYATTGDSAVGSSVQPAPAPLLLVLSDAARRASRTTAPAVMPPRRKKAKFGETSIKWDEQPIVEGGTFETPYGRLQTREYPPTGGRVKKAQIGRLHDDDSWEKLVAKCYVPIGKADDRDTVLETYRQHYDDETMEAAAEAREEQGRAAVEAATAASDEMGLRGGRVAQPKSDAPPVKYRHAAGADNPRRRNALIASYYRDRGATPLFDRTWGGAVTIERLGGGSAGLLSCVSEQGAYRIRQHPLLKARFAKLTPATDEVEDADDVVEVFGRRRARRRRRGRDARAHGRGFW